MANINISGDNNDKFYRYKMPRLQAKVEGKGNGIKTVIPNMTDIARSLGRPPAYPTKFFGCELGALVTCDAKNDRYIVNGQHSADRLQQLLQGFINKFVLCPSCKNPETDLVIKKDYIIRVCKACGAKNDVDLRHKLTTFILKNPPDQANGKGDKKSGKKGKKNKDAEATSPSSKTANGLPTPPDTASNDSNDDGDDELTRRIAEEAAQLPEVNDDDDDDWAVDTSAEAVAARMKDLSVGGAVAKITGDDDDDDGDDPLEAFGDFIANNPKASDKEIYDEAQDLGVRDHKACTVLMQVLFDAKITPAQIAKRAPLLKKFLTSEKAQKGLLGGFERLVGVMHKKELMPKVPIFLKAFYDEELIDEEVFLAWGAKASKRYVEKSVSKEIRAKAEPFLNWLQNAEEEESDDDEDDE
ncbi:hypothetical protein HK102_007256 [Quaeritorhiza haematococci]|nr:hypothetical protein HK102_007256 [Quaeritorhiza haematococci]